MTTTVAAVLSPTTTQLVERAVERDEEAWRALVDRYTRLVWHVIRAMGHFGEVAADVHQATWLHLAENIGRVRNPEALGSWLATTARRECIRVGNKAGKESRFPDHRGDGSGTEPDDLLANVSSIDFEPLDGQLLATERDAALWQAFAALSPQCQQLIRLMLVEPPFSYDEISVILDMPKGSIGPTRRRCLERLRNDPRVAALEETT